MEKRCFGEETQAWNLETYLRVVWFFTNKFLFLQIWALGQLAPCKASYHTGEAFAYINTTYFSHCLGDLAKPCQTLGAWQIIKIGTVWNICWTPRKTHVAQISGNVILHFFAYIQKGGFRGCRTPQTIWIFRRKIVWQRKNYQDNTVFRAIDCHFPLIMFRHCSTGCPKKMPHCDF